jgi:hypothetical protein
MILVIPALVGTLVTSVGIVLLLKSRATRHWRKVTGTVVEIAIETSRGQPGSNINTVFYRPQLHYKYVFNGVVRRGSQILAGRVTSRSNAVELGRQYAAGQAIDVFVDEKHPHKHTLHRGIEHQYWWLVAIGAFWLGAAFLISP